MNRRLIEMLLYGEKIQAEIDGYTELEIPKKEYKEAFFDNFKRILEELIPLNEQWKNAVKNLKFQSTLKINITEYEQLAVYFIYRHFLSAVYFVLQFYGFRMITL